MLHFALADLRKGAHAPPRCQNRQLPPLDPAGGLPSPRPPELAPFKFIFWIRPCHFERPVGMSAKFILFSRIFS